MYISSSNSPCRKSSFTSSGVFGEQEGLVLVITSRIKPEILGHAMHIVFKKVSKRSSSSSAA